MRIEDFVPTAEQLIAAGLKDDEVEEVREATVEALIEEIEQKKASPQKAQPPRKAAAKPWYMRDYGAGYVMIGRQKEQVDAISASEVYSWYMDTNRLFSYGRITDYSAPYAIQLHRLWLMNAWYLFQWLRVVKKKANGMVYRGPFATESGLVTDLVRPVDFDKTSWSFTPSAAGEYTWLSTMQIGNYQGLAIIGHIDEKVVEGGNSVVDAVKVIKNNIEYPARSTYFKVNNAVMDSGGGYYFIPSDTVQIVLHVEGTTESKYHPVGVILTTLDKARNLTANRIKA